MKKTNNTKKPSTVSYLARSFLKTATCVRRQVALYRNIFAILTGSVYTKHTTVPERERDPHYLEGPCTKTFWRVIAWVIRTCDSPFIDGFLFSHYCFSTS